MISRTQKVTNHIMYLFVILAGLIITVGSFWSLYPYNVIEFDPITLNKTEYRAGDNLDINIAHCKHLPLPATLHRQFVNDVTYLLPSIGSSNVSTGCAEHRAVDINIPMELTPGDYIYRQSMEYQVNPIRKVVVVFETPAFHIAE